MTIMTRAFLGSEDKCLKALKPEGARKESMKVSELIEGKQEMSPEKRHLHLVPR